MTRTPEALDPLLDEVIMLVAEVTSPTHAALAAQLTEQQRQIDALARRLAELERAVSGPAR